MSNRYGLIVLVLTVVLLISGAALFLAKNNVAAFFANSEDLASLSKPIKLSSSLVSIDDSVIKSETFKSLKNNVNNFSFNDICKRSNAVAGTPKVITPKNADGSEATTTPVQDISCRQGNNSPFLIKTK